MRFFSAVFFLIFFQVFLTSCPRDAAPDVDLTVAIPQNSAVIIQTNDFQDFYSQLRNSRFFNAADSLPSVIDLRNRWTELAGYFAADSLSNLLKNRPAVAAVALSGAEKFDVLWLAPASLKWKKKLSKNLSESYNFSKKKYAQAELWTFSAKDSLLSNFYFCSYQNIWMISGNRPLVEAAIRQVDSETNLLQDADFQKLKETAASKDLANVYVNLAETEPLFQKWIPNGDASFLKKTGSWAELDLQVEENTLLLTGLTLSPAQAPYYLQSFQGVNPVRSAGAEIVPLNAAIWFSMTFSNPEQFYRNYQSYLKKDGRLRKQEQLVAQISANPEAAMLFWVDTEMGYFSFNGQGGQNRKVAYIKHRTEQGAQNALDSIAEENFIEGYRGLIIKKLKPENALPRFYGQIFQDFRRPYFVVNEDFVFFSDDLSVLKGVLNDVLDGKTFGKNLAFLKFYSELPSRQHITVVASVANFLPWLGAFLEKENQGILKENQAALEDVSWAALQMKASNDAVFTNFFAGHFPEKDQETVVRQWSTSLKNPAIGSPQFLKNHRTNQMDVAIQDEKNRLYLLQNDGKILWEVQLDGKILGEIHQADFYKNRKLQMVFNTENSLYVLDRLGRNVEGFPKKFPKKASAPMAVFDYSNSRDYRMVVPLGNDLKNYDKSGKEVSGWNFKSVESQIISQPKHFISQAKDVIAVYAKNGELLLLNRRGEKRAKNLEKVKGLTQDFYFREGEDFDDSEILALSKSGKLVTVEMDGNVDSIYYERDLAARHFMLFDGKLIFSAEEKIYIKDGENPWEAELESTISEKPKAMILDGQFYVGAFSKNAEEIRIFDENGEIVFGFPVFAQGGFDMGSLKRNGQLNLVTYSEDGTIICYSAR